METRNTVYESYFVAFNQDKSIVHTGATVDGGNVATGLGNLIVCDSIIELIESADKEGVTISGQDFVGASNKISYLIFEDEATADIRNAQFYYAAREEFQVSEDNILFSSVTHPTDGRVALLIDNSLLRAYPTAEDQQELMELYLSAEEMENYFSELPADWTETEEVV